MAVYNGVQLVPILKREETWASVVSESIDITNPRLPTTVKYGL